MKNKFLDMPRKKQIILFVSLYIISFIFTILSSAAAVFAFLTCVSLVFAIIFTVWFSKSKKSTNNDNNIEKYASHIFNDVKIIDIDGTEKFVSEFSVIQGDLCLYLEGGKTYHTHVGCFNKWKPEMKENFDHWTVITLDEAKGKGLNKCSFCEYSDLPVEEKIEKKIAGRKYIIAKLTGCSKGDIQENVNCASELDEVSIEFDDEKEKYAVNDDANCCLGYLSASIQRKLEDLPDDIETLECFVYSVENDDYGNGIVNIAIITE